MLICDPSDLSRVPLEGNVFNSFRAVATIVHVSCCFVQKKLIDTGNDVRFLRGYVAFEQATNHRKFPAMISICSASFLLSHVSNRFAVTIIFDCSMWWM